MNKLKNVSTASLRYNLSTSEIIILVILSILLFIPTLSPKYYDENSSATESSLRSDIVQFYGGCSIAACTPLLIDLLLDFTFETHSAVLVFRLLSLLSLVVFDLALLLSRDSTYCGLIVNSFSYAQLFIQVTLDSCFIYQLDDRRVLSKSRLGLLILLFYLLMANNIVNAAVSCYPSILYVSINIITGFGSVGSFLYGTYVWSRGLHADYRRAGIV
jgi:hypothetical protein